MVLFIFLQFFIHLLHYKCLKMVTKIRLYFLGALWMYFYFLMFLFRRIINVKIDIKLIKYVQFCLFIFLWLWKINVVFMPFLSVCNGVNFFKNFFWLKLYQFFFIFYRLIWQTILNFNYFFFSMKIIFNFLYPWKCFATNVFKTIFFLD